MARAKLVVPTITEALKQVRHFKDAAGFMIAPLSQRGGQRSYYVVASEEDKWVRDGDGEELVPLDTDPEDLPPLPHSKIGAWAFSFVTSRGEPIKPEILVTKHGAKDAPEKEQQTTETKESAAPPPRLVASPRNEAIAVLTESLKTQMEDSRHERQQYLEHLRQNWEQTRLILTSARQEIEAVNSSRRNDLELMTKVKQDEIVNLRASVDRLEAHLQTVVTQNMEITEKNMMLQNKNQFWDTFGEIFKGKPEELMQAFERVVGGLKSLSQGDPK